MSLLKNRWLTIAASLVLGGVFLYSSRHKIADPPDFAHIVFNYKLVPANLINVVAIFMPWFEVMAGLAVLTGLGRRGGALGLALLCILFLGALGYNLHRGHPTICGCFDTYAAGKKMTDAEKFFAMKKEMALDFGLLLLALQVFFASTRRSREGEAPFAPSPGLTPASAPR